MRVTLLWIINVRINSSLKDLWVVAWLGGLAVSSAREMDIHECRDVTEIEDAGISELDRFAQQFLFGDHVPCDGVPCTPKIVPVCQSWDWMRGILVGRGGIRHSRPVQ